MIHRPLFIFLTLAAIEAAVLWAAAHPRTKHLFKFLPSVFWIYFLPMLASTAGLIGSKSPLYGWSVTYVLPASLFILLIGVDLTAIARLGKKGLAMFLIGSLGIMAGTAVSFAVFKNIVGPDFYSGFGALSASWMGGSANMVAVKEAVGTPDNVFLPMVVVDTVVPYVWMAVLIAGSTWQDAVDHFNGADQGVLKEIHQRLKGLTEGQPVRFSVPAMAGLILLAAGVSAVLKWGAAFLPVVEGIVSPFTWTIVLVSLLGLAFSFTSLRGMEGKGSTKTGYALLYFVLTTIGARASLSDLGTSGVLILAGFLIVLIHAVVLFAAARLLKAPIMLAAASSQANIGGVASGPIVAGVYQPGLAAIGLLMAVFGNVIGTYLGIITTQICRMIGS